MTKNRRNLADIEEEQKTIRENGPVPPIAAVRIGNIRAAIWENAGKYGSLYSIAFKRSYIDDYNTWRESSYFRSKDLLTLMKVADIAHSYILELGDKNIVTEIEVD